jgi:hypothetical protein
MAVMHYIDRARGISFAEFSEICTLMDLQVYHLNLLSDPNWRPGMRRMVDFGEVTAFEISPLDASKVLDRIAAFPESSDGAGVAVVAPRHLLTGTDGMFRLMTGGPRPGVRIFRTRQEALRWLVGKGELTLLGLETTDRLASRRRALSPL